MKSILALFLILILPVAAAERSVNVLDGTVFVSADETNEGGEPVLIAGSSGADANLSAHHSTCQPQAPSERCKAFWIGVRAAGQAAEPLVAIGCAAAASPASCGAAATVRKNDHAVAVCTSDGSQGTPPTLCGGELRLGEVGYIASADARGGATSPRVCAGNFTARPSGPSHYEMECAEATFGAAGGTAGSCHTSGRWSMWSSDPSRCSHLVIEVKGSSTCAYLDESARGTSTRRQIACAQTG